MPLRFLLDEQLRGGGLWLAIQQHNAAGANKIDVVRVGDPPDLPLGTSDADNLLWAEREGRILVSRDVRTLPAHLAAHLQAGHHSPGVLIIRRRSGVPQVLAYLELAAYAADPAAYQDHIEHIP
jgi:hypothetical protein